jgi:hypothetical protein
MRVRVFLRQPLFTLPGKEHVPANAVILEGTLGEGTALGVQLSATAYFDERGRALAGAPSTLLLPGAKLDHVQVLE